MTAPVGRAQWKCKMLLCLFRELPLMNFMHLNFRLRLVIMAAQLKPFRQMDSHLEWQCARLLLVNHEWPLLFVGLFHSLSADKLAS